MLLLTGERRFVTRADPTSTKLSKALQDDANKLTWRTVDELKEDFGVELHLNTEVTAIDPGAQTVTTAAGTINYDHLVLSPGANPRKIPIPGADLEGVVTIRTPHDIKKITSSLSKDADVIIIGTSFIGLEAAGAIAKKDHKSLTVVGVDEIPFEAMLGKDLGLSIVKSLEGQGIKFHRGVNVEKITAGADGKVAQLHVKGIDPLPATIVIMGTGVAPATQFLKDTFKLEKDGGITVDEYLRVPGVKNVYALGDIVHYPQFPAGNSRRVEHWNVAGNHGRHVGRTIATPDKDWAFKQAPVFWSSVGKGLRYVGTGEEFDESYLDGSAEDLKFVLYQAKAGRIVTVTSMGRDPIVAKASELIRLGAMPTLEEVKTGKSLLEIKA